ncbi:MAG: hypothetical protein DRN96_01980 [Thermoproteota archaeon]|nr:MAG: hypothetical protein DRN96_01980 [Candidatus Korarchaeota archaeon]RLG55600.1 MAG: hypothetical protein DRN99_02200 [Candidatus Korarchaeota archaeon]
MASTYKIDAIDMLDIPPNIRYLYVVARKLLKSEEEEGRIVALPEHALKTRHIVKVIGVGGGGCNTVTRLASLGVNNAELIALNTDIAHMKRVTAHKKVLIGQDLTKGRGCGGNPDCGFRSAEESAAEIEELIGEAEVVFVALALGGGTGTGAAPVICKIAEEKGALVFVVATLPSPRHERVRYEKSLQWINRIREHAHTIALVSNSQIFELFKELPLNEALKLADTGLALMVKGLTDIINEERPGIINIDLADLRAIATKDTDSVILIGYGEGERRAEDALYTALNFPLFPEIDLTTTRAAIIYIRGPDDLLASEVNYILEAFREKIPEDAEVIWGYETDATMEGLELILVVSGVANIEAPSTIPAVQWQLSQARGRPRVRDKRRILEEVLDKNDWI